MTAEPAFLCVACGEPVGLSDAGRGVRCPRCGRSYPVEDGIVLLGAGQVRGAFDEGFFPQLDRVEGRHFWFKARRDLVVDTLRETLGGLSRRRVLDLGCGTGFILASLERAGAAVWGMDQSFDGLRRARGRSGATLLHGSALDVRFAPAFDAVLLCDVIEHVAEQDELMRRAAAAAGSGGVVLLTVPAGDWLWSPIDEVSGHQRRYSRRSLRRVIEGAGLRIVTLRWFNSLLLPAVFLRALAARRTHDAAAPPTALSEGALWVPPFPLSAVLDAVARLDVALGPLLPIGASLLAVARPR